MRKIKFLCSILVLTLSTGLFSSIVRAVPTDSSQYNLEQMMSIYDAYDCNYSYLESLLCKSDNFSYWKLIEQDKNNATYSWLIDMSSIIIDQKPDEERYTEMLIDLIALQEGSISSQVESQSQYDTLKTGKDYAWDALDLALTVCGTDTSETIGTIKSVIDTYMDENTLHISNTEEFKYYKASLQTFAQMDYFLASIEKYSQINDMQEAAKNLRVVSENLLSERLKYIANNPTSNTKFSADFFMSDTFYDFLKQTNNYSNNKTFQLYVNGAEKVATQFLSLGKFTFDAMMLIGNVGFGTSNTFNRYQEMKAMADISQSLSNSVGDVTIPYYISTGTIGDIQRKCEYYDSLLSVHSRGEYLVYSLLTKDAGLLSIFRVLSETGKDYEDTTEGRYNQKISLIQNAEANINNIFNAPESVLVVANPKLNVYASNDSLYYNYHYKVEKLSISDTPNPNNEYGLNIETLQEGDITEETTVILTPLTLYPSNTSLYRITISDLSDEPGETQSTLVVVSNSANAGQTINFYTDYVQPIGDIIEKANLALDGVKSMHLSQTTTSDYSVSGSNVNMSMNLESDVNITSGITYSNMTTSTGGRSRSNEIYVQDTGNTYDIYLSSYGTWVKQTGVSSYDINQLGSGFEGVDGIKFYLNSMENISIDENSDPNNYIVSGIIGSSSTEEALRKGGMTSVIDQLDEDDEISDSDIQSMLHNLSPMKITFYINKSSFLPSQMAIDMKDTTESIYRNIQNIASKYNESITYTIRTNKAVTYFSKYNELSEIFIPDEAVNGTDYNIIR